MHSMGTVEFFGLGRRYKNEFRAQWISSLSLRKVRSKSQIEGEKNYVENIILNLLYINIIYNVEIIIKL